MAAISISLWILWWQHYNFLSFLFYVTLICISPTSSASGLKFTRVPPRVLYVSRGNAATLDWEYDLPSKNNGKHREIEITWKLHLADKTTMLLAFQYHAQWDSFLKVYNNRYRTRIRGINNGYNTTLVISNMTTDDSGLYGCQVSLREDSVVRRYVRDMVQVIVTERPQFTTPALPREYTIGEGQNLSITCSARGSPQPNVTWVRVQQGEQDRIMVSGVGSATLSMRNIQRDQGGVYQCRATNNPKESPVTMETRVNVKYIRFSPKNTTVTVGNEIRLQCIPGLSTTPLITWHRTDGTSSLIRSYGCNYGNQILVIPAAIQSDAGIYVCSVTELRDGKLFTLMASAHVTVRGPPPSPLISRVVQVKKYSTVILQWQKVSSQDSPVTKYAIYRRTREFCDVMSPWKQVTIVTMPAELRYNITGLSPDVTHQFLVTSWNKFGESAKDESKSITVRVANKSEEIANAGGKEKNHQVIPVQETSCQTFAVVTAASVATNLILLLALFFFICKLHRLSETLRVRKLTVGDPRYEALRSSYRSGTEKGRDPTPSDNSEYETPSMQHKNIIEQPFTVFKPQKRKRSLVSNSESELEFELEEIPSGHLDRGQSEPLHVRTKDETEEV